MSGHNTVDTLYGKLYDWIVWRSVTCIFLLLKGGRLTAVIGQSDDRSCTGVLYYHLIDGDGWTVLGLCDWSVRRSVPVFSIIVLPMETGGQPLSSVIGLSDDL